jgi:hypothetical protein
MNSGPKWSLRNGAQYRRLCARPGCGAAAVATLRFQSTQRQAWLVELDANASRTQGDLCQRHAAALVLPRGWELHDERAPGPWTPVSPGGPDARSAEKRGAVRKSRTQRKKAAPATEPADALPGLEPVTSGAVEVPHEPEPVAPVAPVVDAEPEVSAEPASEPEVPGNGHAARPVPAQFGASDEEGVEEELGEILDARTPLLQRAFRNAKPQTDEPEPEPEADPQPE